MPRALPFAFLFVSLLLAAGAQAADAETGEAIFKRQCTACHRLVPGRAMGPSLLGIFDRPAGSVDGYRYSTAMKKAGFAWNAEKLTQFLHSPRTTVPGTIMPFAGIRDDGQVADLVAYLESLKPSP